MSSLKPQLSQTRSSSFNKEKLILFIAGCAIGAACFLCIYGISIINPLYDAWLFNGDMDLRQHYIGWCHYRMSDWHFPIGLIDSLSYPVSVSCIYTDSIPLFAVIFKLFRNILPDRFQYFGIFGLVSFCLQGGLASLIIYRLINKNKEDNKLYVIISSLLSVIFILAPTVIQRMFYHTALGAQWIILLCIYMWLCNKEICPKKRILYWALIGMLIVSIHSYFLPMGGIILLASCVDLYLNMNTDEARGKRIIPLITDICIYCLAAIMMLFILGGFYGKASAIGEGLGTFSSNINTFINPIYGSVFFKEMPLYNPFQYEGYAYLGLGIILFSVVAIIYIFAEIMIRMRLGKLSFIKALSDCFSEHKRYVIGLVVVIVTMCLASFPVVTFNEKKLFGVPYPSIIRSVLSIFRSNGRFIWIAMYLVMLGSITLTFNALVRIIRKNKSYIFIGISILVVCLQCYDLSKVVSDKQSYYKSSQQYVDMWENSYIADNIANYDKFIFLYNENDIIMDTAFYAYLNGMSINNYYYARNYDDLINAIIEQRKIELSNDLVDEKAIYIIKKSDYIAGKYEALDWHELGEHMIGVLR